MVAHARIFQFLTYATYFITLLNRYLNDRQPFFEVRFVPYSVYIGSSDGPVSL